VPALAASNHRIRRLRRLSGRRSARSADDAFVLEGPTLVAEALDRRADLEAVYLDEAAAADLAPVAEQAAVAGVAVHLVAPGVLAGITDTVTPRPVLAVAAIPRADLGAVIEHARSDRRHLVLLVDVRDPGNLGTIIRAADASGAAAVICATGSVDPWSPKVVRSSAGSVLHVPIVTGLDAPTVLDVLARARIPTVGTVVRGGTPYDRTSLAGSPAIVLGNEAHGLPAELAERIDQAVTIPMDGRAESLNVAMAASILMFEALRQRRIDHTGPPAGHSDWTTEPADDKVISP
jgi:RNA methyltransferase, TrmH family